MFASNRFVKVMLLLLVIFSVSSLFLIGNRICIWNHRENIFSSNKLKEYQLLDHQTEERVFKNTTPKELNVDYSTERKTDSESSTKHNEVSNIVKHNAGNQKVKHLPNETSTKTSAEETAIQTKKSSNHTFLSSPPPTTSTSATPTTTTSTSTSPTPKTTTSTKNHVNQPQKCRIPIIDPFHREALLYSNFNYTEKCHIHQNRTQVQHGRLLVNTTGSMIVKIGWFQRKQYSDDYEADYEVVVVFNRTNGNIIKDTMLNISMKTDFANIIFIREDGTKTTEWRLYPVKTTKNIPFEKYELQKDKFNVLLIMFDSFSHASAVRYLPKTYNMMQLSQYSTILKGHTIVGDATTPQLSAMFFGEQPENLRPEGRRGVKNSQPIDSWPSIFKEYRKSGYVTLKSEDDPYLGAFNFRLRGFKDPPTDKYLRPWWWQTNNLLNLNATRAASCPTVYHNSYLKDFYNEYAKELSFAHISNSVLTHGTPHYAKSVDDEMLNLFKHMNRTGKLASTIVIFYGDHGSRATEFRAILQGKMEERLPLMTLTIPPKFHSKFPDKVKHLKRNSKVLTTPYDIHVTLKHLLDITSPPPDHKFGQSLFTDIVGLNRTCSDSGVPQFWCICSAFKEINTNESIVKQVSLEMVNKINDIISVAETKCEVLQLKDIVRASKLIQNEYKSYETYEVTFRVSPSNGLYEGTGEYHKQTRTIKVSKNFSRINLYGDQPKCIAQLYPSLRKFCYCKP